MITPALVLAMMAKVHPAAPTTGYAPTFAAAIAYVAEHDPPPPGRSALEGAAWMAVTAWEEGRYCMGCRRGDRGISVCTFQVMSLDERRRRQLEVDPLACTRAAYYIMRQSAKLCPAHPLAPYAGGCFSQAAQAISRFRLQKASELTQGF